MNDGDWRFTLRLNHGKVRIPVDVEDLIHVTDVVRGWVPALPA